MKTKNQTAAQSQFTPGPWHPDLLQSAIELVSDLDKLTAEKFSQGGWRVFHRQLRRAIAKARGEKAP